MAAEQPESNDTDGFPLTPDHRMLLRMRDTLYEGNWDDFLHDLRARADSKPHVFEIVPASPQMKGTIAGHIGMIERMRDWESRHGCTLRADDNAGDG